MNKTSTPCYSNTSSKTRKEASSYPRRQTIDLIRQFARAYVAVPAIGGIVLN